MTNDDSSLDATIAGATDQLQKARLQLLAIQELERKTQKELDEIQKSARQTAKQVDELTNRLEILQEQQARDKKSLARTAGSTPQSTQCKSSSVTASTTSTTPRGVGSVTNPGTSRPKLIRSLSGQDENDSNQRVPTSISRSSSNGRVTPTASKSSFFARLATPKRLQRNAVESPVPNVNQPTRREAPSAAYWLTSRIPHRASRKISVSSSDGSIASSASSSGSSCHRQATAAVSTPRCASSRTPKASFASAKGGVIARAECSRHSYIPMTDTPGVGHYDVTRKDKVIGGEIGDGHRALPWARDIVTSTPKSCNTNNSKRAAKAQDSGKKRCSSFSTR